MIRHHMQQSWLLSNYNRPPSLYSLFNYYYTLAIRQWLHFKCINEWYIIFSAIYCLFNVVEHLWKKLVPVIVYVTAATNSRSSPILPFFSLSSLSGHPETVKSSILRIFPWCKTYCQLQCTDTGDSFYECYQ